MSSRTPASVVPADAAAPLPGSSVAWSGPSLETLRIEDLSPGARVVLRTDDAAYEITIISPRLRQVVVCGAPSFPNPLGVDLDGCSRDGRFLEVGAIRVGCSLELRTGAGVVVTGPVRSIGFAHEA